jgi:hypothetical protein
MRRSVVGDRTPTAASSEQPQRDRWLLAAGSHASGSAVDACTSAIVCHCIIRMIGISLRERLISSDMAILQPRDGFAG